MTACNDAVELIFCFCDIVRIRNAEPAHVSWNIYNMVDTPCSAGKDCKGLS